MSERTLEQALARAEIARQPGACHLYSVATYHDALVDLVLLADEVKRLRATGVERMEAEVKALAFLCNDTERTFKGRDVEISTLKERVVEAAEKWVNEYEARGETTVGDDELYFTVCALIAAREKK